MVITTDALTRRTREFIDVATSGVRLGEPISDKVTSHSYELMYAQFLLPLHADLQAAGQRLKLLEIGMSCDMVRGSPGASTTLWTRVLPNAEVWQAELHGDCAKRIGSKLPVHVLVGDQGDPTVVRSWVRTTGGGFHAIIDDGGHANNQIRNSFDVLWPALLPGGVYFIEDLHVSRASPTRPDDFTMVDRLHSWSDQLLNSRLSRPHADTWANRRAHYENSRHPMPHSVAFVFMQRDAAVLGKHTRAGLTAQRAHRQFPDLGGGPLHAAGELSALSTIVGAYAEEGGAAMGAAAEVPVCVMLTATTTPTVDLRTTSYGARQQRRADKRRQLYAGVLEHWLQVRPPLPTMLVENSGDDLTWAKNIAARAPTTLSATDQRARLELHPLTRAANCTIRDEIGCHEADAIWRAVRASRLIGQGPGGFLGTHWEGLGTHGCSHVLKVTGRYAVTSDVHAALRRCGPRWDVAVQNTSWRKRGPGSMVFGFRADLHDALFGWSQLGGQGCQECHLQDWVRQHPNARVCRLRRLRVRPVIEGSTGDERSIV